MGTRRIRITVASVVLLSLLVWVFSSPVDRYLFVKELQLWSSGFRREEVRTSLGAFGYYVGGTNRNAAPLILVHGLGLFPEYWEPLMLLLADEFRICAVELLGFGRSMDPSISRSEYTLSLYTRQIETLMEILQWDRPILVGVSLGGWIAARYALAHEYALRGLVLVSPVGLDTSRSLEELERLREIFDFRTPEQFRRLVYEYLDTEQERIPQILARVAVYQASRGAYRALLENLTEEDWIGTQVHRLSLSTALIWGTLDRVSPHRGGMDLSRNMPRARLFTLEGTGHDYLLRHRRETLAAVQDALRWIREQEATAPVGRASLH